jgi:hypothetical protein
LAHLRFAGGNHSLERAQLTVEIKHTPMVESRREQNIKMQRLLKKSDLN